MNYLKFKLLLIITSILLISSCSKDNNPIINNETINNNKTVDRTLLVYMLANNNLNENLLENIDSLVSSTKRNPINKGRLLVYIDYDNSNSELLEINNGVKTIIKKYNNQNSATPEVMRSIIKDVKDISPSLKYGLVLAGHATNWLPSANLTQYRSYGTDGGRWMEINQIDQAIPDNFFDFIIFDACYMASVEVAYEFRNKADYIVASAAEVFGDGIMFAGVVNKLFNSEPDLKSICDEAYKIYNNNSVEKYRTMAISLIYNKNINSLAQSIKNIFINNINNASNVDLSQIQYFDRPSGTGFRQKYPVMFDLEDYIEKIASNEEFDEFKKLMKDVVLYERHTDYLFKGDRLDGEIKVNKHCGITIYPYYSIENKISQNENIPFDVSLSNQFYKDNVDWFKSVYK